MPFITQGKTNLKYILIIIILAAIVGGGVLGYLHWQVLKQEAKLMEFPEVKLPKKPTDETADWKTYRNEEYGFEIKYLPDWRVVERPSEGLITFYTGLEPLGFVDTIQVTINTKTLNEWLEEQDLSLISSFERFILDGAEAIRVDTRESGTLRGLTRIATRRGEKFYLIKTTEGTMIDSGMLSTFKFIRKFIEIEEEEIANWKVYRHEDYEYEIKYPGGWDINYVKYSFRFLVTEITKDLQKKDIMLTSIPFEEYDKECEKLDYLNPPFGAMAVYVKVIDPRAFTIEERVSPIYDGYIKLRMNYFQRQEDDEFRRIYDTLEVGGMWDSRDPRDDEFRRIYDQILSTFKFLE